MLKPLIYQPDFFEEKGAVYQLHRDGRILRVLQYIMPEEKDLVGQTPETIILHPHIASKCRKMIKKAIRTGKRQKFLAQVIRGDKQVLRYCTVERISEDSVMIHSHPFNSSYHKSEYIHDI